MTYDGWDKTEDGKCKCHHCGSVDVTVTVRQMVFIVCDQCLFYTTEVIK